MSQTRRSGAATLLPVIAAAAIVIAAIFFLLREERRAEHAALQTVALGVAKDFHLDFEKALTALLGVKAFWLGSEAVTSEEFQVYAKTLENSVNEFAAIEWVDEGNIVRYVYPLEGVNLQAVGLDNNLYPNRLQAIEAAKAEGTMGISPPIMLVQGFPGMIIYVPIFKEGTYAGSAVGVVKLSSLFTDAADFIDMEKYDVMLRNGDKLMTISGTALYTVNGERVIGPDGKTAPDPHAPKPLGKGAAKVPLMFGDQVWELQLQERSLTLTPELAVGAVGIFFICVTVILCVVLYRQRRAMEETSARERDFTALVSHQLRIPLTEMSWMMETVFETSTDMTPERAETIQQIRTILRNGTRLINDLLNISKIERGVLKLNCEEVSVGDLVAETVKVLQRQAQEKRIELTVDIPEKTSVFADRQKAMEALRNVVDNAIKYSPTRAFVRIAAKETNENVVISVKDSGPGILPEVQPKIFDKASAFSRKGTNEGAGLGLYLTKQFVEMMGGTVRFETSPKGTTFFVTLPKEDAGQCEPAA